MKITCQSRHLPRINNHLSFSSSIDVSPRQQFLCSVFWSRRSQVFHVGTTTDLPLVIFIRILSYGNLRSNHSLPATGSIEYVHSFLLQPRTISRRCSPASNRSDHKGDAGFQVAHSFELISLKNIPKLLRLTKNSSINEPTAKPRRGHIDHN